MKKIVLNKMVDVLNNGHIPYSIRYQKLEAELANDIEIEVEYSQGMRKSKERQLARLGFSMKTEIWSPNPDIDPIWTPVKAVWAK